jgi:ABC-type multidrug transport system fused ATPase/permease subunit
MSRATGGGVRALLHDYRTFAGSRLWAALALMLLGALAEGFGLLMIVPLASIAIGDKAGALGRIAGPFNSVPANERLLVALGLFVAFMAARSALLYARELELTRLQSGYEASLRLRAASTLAARGWPFASRIGQAGMQALLLTDVSRASTAVGFAQTLTVAAVMLAVQFLLTLFLSPALALIAFAIICVGSLAAARWTKRGVASGIALAEQSEQSTSSGFRLHAGLKAALAQGSVPQFIDEYAATLARARDEWIHFSRDLNSSRQLAALAAAVAAAVLLFVGLRMLALPFPVLIASLALFARMVAPAQALQQSAQHFVAYAQSFAAIEHRLGQLELAPRNRASPTPFEWKELRLDGAAFEHQPGLPPTSLVVRKGEWIGIGGPSGAGKTTLIDLVAGLLVPGEGEIRVDGLLLDAGRLEQWRATLAYVGQDGTVFNDSVRGNLDAGAKPAADDALWAALELVGLASRVKAFDRGLDQAVGDRGSQLSGGERQRLVIARGLLRRPSLLILDEATAALDAASEAALLRRLRALDSRPAALIVAHRQSTLVHCDSVVEIQHKEEKSARPSEREG